jgi:N6-adenosine-specific RNA methylase IME4
MADADAFAEGREAKAMRHYGSMSFKDIEALPVGQLAAPHCIIFLWCTWPLLLHGGDPKRHFKDADASRSPVGACLKAMGLPLRDRRRLAQENGARRHRVRPGYRARSAPASRSCSAAAAQPKNSRSERNLIEGLARAHSRKPEEAYAWCERYMPGARRVELFSRTSRPGWDTWGFEAGKFDATVTTAGAA